MPLEISGMDDLLARLARTGANVEATKKKALLKGAEVIRTEIEARAPVDTGFLKDHIVIFENAGADYVNVGPSKEVYYAKMIEFGTKKGNKLSPNPFVELAYLAKRTEAKEAIAEVIREEIDNG